jgi:nicotinamide-nucleotide amidase
MVQGVQGLFDAEIAVSITGIAGPGGGTLDKPVGLTYIALLRRGRTPQVRRHIWRGDRDAIKSASANAALSWILSVAEESD